MATQVFNQVQMNTICMQAIEIFAVDRRNCFYSPALALGQVYR